MNHTPSIKFNWTKRKKRSQAKWPHPKQYWICLSCWLGGPIFEQIHVYCSIWNYPTPLCRITLMRAPMQGLSSHCARGWEDLFKLKKWMYELSSPSWRESLKLCRQLTFKFALSWLCPGQFNSYPSGLSKKKKNHQIVLVNDKSVNTLWLSDAIWQHKSMSTLDQLNACRLSE